MARRKKSETKNDSEWVSVQDKRKRSKAKRDNECEESDVFRLENDEVWICQGYKIRFEGDNHKLVDCEYCDKHFCIKCIHKTEMEYTIMYEKVHIHWFCPPCDAKVIKNLKIEKKL